MRKNIAILTGGAMLPTAHANERSLHDANSIYLYLHRRLFNLSGRSSRDVTFRLTRGIESMFLRQLCKGDVNPRNMLQSAARLIADAHNPKSPNYKQAQDLLPGVLRSLDVVGENLCHKADTSLRQYGYKLLRNTFK